MAAGEGVLALLCSTCILILSSLEHRCVGCSDCGGVLAFLLSSFEHRCAGSSDCGGVLAFLLSSLEHHCAGSSDCRGVLEYIEPMCIEAHLEAHV